ncbi:unnamed protein product [Protopolystoma xenopodis]|uniref:Uncharacterized protein n=1 Tax=Protopolystoma xenopodis TaxID=117903 RepID=A0A3S4ZYV9_9PLAT|nr:unnamed protein product [Protopolystoma xenopodis]
MFDFLVSTDLLYPLNAWSNDTPSPANFTTTGRSSSGSGQPFGRLQPICENQGSNHAPGLPLCRHRDLVKIGGPEVPEAAHLVAVAAAASLDIHATGVLKQMTRD